MVKDDPCPTRVSDIATRVNRSRSWVNKYREILINEKIIRSAGYGLVEFAIPNLGKYLQRRKVGLQQ